MTNARWGGVESALVGLADRLELLRAWHIGLIEGSGFRAEWMG